MNTQEGVYVLVSQDRWEKTRRIISDIHSMESEGNEGTDRSKLESIRGFLVYVARTHRYTNPYLKGLHLNMDSWSPYRDDKGWCMKG